MSTDKQALIIDGRIQLSFPYNTRDVELVRGIPDRTWDKPNLVWWVPATPYHAEQVIKTFQHDFFIDSEIYKLEKGVKVPPKPRYLKEAYPFQNECLDFVLSTGGRCIIADDVGTGKTVEALSYVNGYCQRTLIISPTNVLYKWKNECSRWVPNATAEVVKTGKSGLPETDIIIMSYGLLPAYYEQLSKIAFDVLVADEAHYVKNYKAQRTRLVKALVRGGIPKVLFLSGTPYQNHPAELFSLVNMLDPIGYSNFFSYAMRYCGAYKAMGSWVFPPFTVTNQDELIHRLTRIMIRRTKSEVIDQLPELERVSVPVELTNRAEYNKERRALRGKVSGENALTMLTSLRSIVGRGKVDAAVELAEDILQADRQVVLFAHHKEIVSLLAQRLKQYGVGLIVGDTKAKERFEKTQKFLAPGSPMRVMIVSTAGAEGIDLYSASDIIFVEREWVPAVEEQVEGRLHRMGQKNAVTAHYLVAKDTIDQKLDETVRLKRKVVGAVIKQNDIVNAMLEEL